jgi:hypothetical protein
LKIKGLQMVADYFNPGDDEIRWGPYVESNEHFETYAMLDPDLGLPAGCLCHHDGEKPEYTAHGHPELCPGLAPPP